MEFSVSSIGKPKENIWFKLEKMPWLESFCICSDSGTKTANATFSGIFLSCRKHLSLLFPNCIQYFDTVSTIQRNRNIGFITNGLFITGTDECKGGFLLSIWTELNLLVPHHLMAALSTKHLFYYKVLKLFPAYVYRFESKNKTKQNKSLRLMRAKL